MLGTTDMRLGSAVQERLEAHAFSDLTREVGGLLIGDLAAGSSTVRDTLPALRARGSRASVTFTHDAWAQLLPKLEREHPGMAVVGWYHTHPGFGLFLSEMDRFIQRSYFDDPRMLALVVDPVAGIQGWFGWDGNRIAMLAEERMMRTGGAASRAGAVMPSSPDPGSAV